MEVTAPVRCLLRGRGASGVARSPGMRLKRCRERVLDHDRAVRRPIRKVLAQDTSTPGDLGSSKDQSVPDRDLPRTALGDRRDDQRAVDRDDRQVRQLADHRLGVIRRHRHGKLAGDDRVELRQDLRRDDEIATHDAWQRRRLSVKPGITGLWQIAGRREPEFDKWVEMDLEYIDRCRRGATWRWSCERHRRFSARRAARAGRGPEPWRSWVTGPVKVRATTRS
jgi:Bacterial sugar transferase